MKPRLKLEYSETHRAAVWFCRGGGALGMAPCCPFHAYQKWLWRLQEIKYRAHRIEQEGGAA